MNIRLVSQPQISPRINSSTFGFFTSGTAMYLTLRLLYAPLTFRPFTTSNLEKKSNISETYNNLTKFLGILAVIGK